MTPTY